MRGLYTSNVVGLGGIMKLNDEAEMVAFAAAKKLAELGIFEFLNTDMSKPINVPLQGVKSPINPRERE